MIDSIQYFFENYSSYFRFQDFIDILIVAYIIYKAFSFIKETRAEQLVKGIIVLVVILLFSDWLGLYTLNYILKNTMQYGVLALLVVFQPELRRGLERVGRSRLGGFFLNEGNLTELDTENVCDEVCDAVGYLSDKRIGCLIVIERHTKVGDIIRTGVHIDSLVSSALLINTFIPNTPLHDGAVILRDNRIMAGRCLLPLTQTQKLSAELGTRHRAAIGMSENSDAIVVVVSEETGKISIALEGSLTRNLTVETLRKALKKLMLPDQSKKPIHKMFKWRGMEK